MQMSMQPLIMHRHRKASFDCWQKEMLTSGTLISAKRQRSVSRRATSEPDDFNRGYVRIDDFEMKTGRYRSAEDHKQMREQQRKDLKELFG